MLFPSFGFYLFWPQNKIGELVQELLTGRGRFIMPVDTVCLELETIADAFVDTGGVVR